MQVSRKQNTYYLEIKEDLSKFHCFALKKKAVFFGKKEKATNPVTKLRLN